LLYFMSKPPLFPDRTASGIAVDPRTLERVIPATKRLDGTVRKEIKIRPGYTPQEDVSLFRTQRQQQHERTALPKGHVIGWTPKEAASKPAVPGEASDSPSGKAAKKNAKRAEKRKEKRKEDQAAFIKSNWEDASDDDKQPSDPPADASTAPDATVDEVTDKLGAVKVEDS